METLVLNPKLEQDITRAGALLKAGGLVAIPTETVYGLAANALDETAVEKIYHAKGRPGDNPLIVHVCTLEEATALLAQIPPKAKLLAHAFWPGPLTLVLPKTNLVPLKTSGGLPTVAIRVPANETARAIIRAAGCPLAAPSANRSGKPSPTEFAHVWADLQGRVDAVVDGGTCAVGVESTVLSLAVDPPCLLRPGGITPEQIEAVIGTITIDAAVCKELQAGQAAASPGMKYKHYAPKASITLCTHSLQDFAALLTALRAQEPQAAALCFTEDLPMLTAPCVAYGSRYNSATQANGLFAALHTLDKKGYTKVLARAPKKRGMGLAVYNRLIRAAGFQLLQPSMAVIGLTGQTGAGKTTVAADLAALGAAVIDCDEVSRNPKTYDKDCILQLKKAFGSDILINGVLQRHILAQRAFATQAGTSTLNRITLPVISKCITALIKGYQAAGKPCVVLDAPTLLEAGADTLCTGILVVTAPKALRLQRIVARDGITEAVALQRMDAQESQEYYVNHADWVVDTAGAYSADDAKEIIKFFEEKEHE